MFLWINFLIQGQTVIRVGIDKGLFEIVYCLHGKTSGAYFIEGTIDDLTFYKMDGKYYVRMKSSLTGKKFRCSKTFERSRESCKRLSEGNKLASKLYGMIGEEKRVYNLFCFLKKRAIQLLKDGKRIVEAEEILLDYLKEFALVEGCKPANKNKTKRNKLNLFSRQGKYLYNDNETTPRTNLFFCQELTQLIVLRL